MKVYKQKLRDVWLQMPEFKPWLRRDPDDSYRAHCKFCKCGVNTKICDLRAHALTKKHIKRSLELGIEIKPNLNDLDETSEGLSYNSNTQYKIKTKPATIKREKPRTSDTVSKSQTSLDYEQIIENLALYEPEQVMFSNCLLTGTEQIIEEEGEVPSGAIFDEEMINKAVANALRNQKDSPQIFGDFVADRLRHMNNDASEFAKDKIMKILLEAASIDRAPTYN
ncbi:uncharacterized protein Dana_GF17496 [Drosophila ananassae]|uniref:BESS domain-containing protein n=1 Tax=Drosophila ananassae TaxID=7217 RepID=B3LVD6_DROAN|nr:uncharacterized protein LOC6500280 [Drosophila ananassae]EDV41464.1 uncharacterized protein Dana_GF17496 [Drosophila ananassae]KAH8331859.1 hypothetical protein KR067_011915 [Drosophila pandora]